MASRAGFTEPCDFQILLLPVSEDAGLITRQFTKLVTDKRILENSPHPQQRAEFKRLFDAGTALKDTQRRRAIVDSHANAFAEYVTQFCAALQRAITHENRQFLIEQGQALAYHLSAELAVAIVDRTLASSATAVNGHNPAPAVPPTLVTGMTVDVVDGWPRLKWQRPAQGADRIVVRAALSTYPARDTDGREVFSGSADECLDHRAPPGRVWYYSAFSYSGIHGSSPESAKASHFFGAGVTNLQAVGDLQQIVVSWQPPPIDHQHIVVFRWRAGTGAGIAEQDAVPRALPGVVERRVGRTTRFVDDQRTGVEPGVLYEYRVYVDYGEVDGRHGCSPGQAITATAVPPAIPVTNLRLESTEAGMAVSWDTPATGCDSVLLVRSSHHPPKTPEDGTIVASERLGAYVDGGLAAGTLYYYTVFSVHVRLPSASASAWARYAPPPVDFRAGDAATDPGWINLTWTVHDTVRGVSLLRRKGSRPEVVHGAGAPILRGGEAVPLRAGQRTTARDRVDPEVDYHYALLADYGDGTWSPAAFTVARAVTPTRPVTAVKLEVLSYAQVSLSWSAPDTAAGAVRYHVWRRVKDLSGTAAAERIATTDQPSFVDRASVPGGHPVSGQTYEYAIQAAVGRVDAVLSPWVEVFVTSDVVLKSAKGVYETVVLEWTPPPNVARVDVRRDGLARPLPAELTRATDSGLSQGRLYTYSITAVFVDANGKEVHARGVRATAMPVHPAEPVRDLSAHYDQGAVHIRWTLPATPVGGVVVSRLDARMPLAVGASVDRSTIGGATELRGDATCFEDPTAPIGRALFYAVYTLNGSTASYSGTVDVPLFAAIDQLKVRNAGSRIWLTWTWPKNADLVRITRTSLSGRTPPASMACTRRQYETAASVFVDTVPARPDRYRYRVQVVGVHGSETLGSLIACSETVPGGAVARIDCRVKKSRKAFNVICSLGGVEHDFGGLVLVGSDTRDPLSIDEGQNVAHYLPGRGPLPKAITLSDDRGGPLYRYYQVFLLEADPLKSMVTLVPPSLADRTCR